MIEKNASTYEILAAKTLVLMKPIRRLSPRGKLIEIIEELSEPLALTEVR
jgi:hypothetical protein